MRVDRRRFVIGALGASAVGANYTHKDKVKKAATAVGPSVHDLDRAAAAPVLKMDGLKSPVVIESIKLLKKDDEYLIHVRSKDGAEGVSLSNPPRAEYLDKILKQLVIPLFINNALGNKPVPVYGDGLNVRDWLHVDDHCRAIDLVFHKGRAGEVYNVGGNNEKTNIEITKLVLAQLGKGEELIKYVADRPGHDRRYAIDSTKIQTELGWTPAHTFETGMRQTIDWYRQNQTWLQSVSRQVEFTAVNVAQSSMQAVGGAL